MKWIKYMLLLFVILACNESSKTENNKSTKEVVSEKKEKALNRYNANQTDYKKDGVLVRLSSSNRPLSGIVYFNFNSGQLAYEREYKDGLLNGRSVSYYENGQKSSEGNFYNDQLHGEVLAWDANGNLEYNRVYNKGKCLSGCD